MTGRRAKRLAGGGPLVWLFALLLVVVGCGGGPGRQDEDEPEGDYEVEVVDQSFPTDQKVAQDSRLRLEVENVDTRTIPNIAVTVEGFDYKLEDPLDPGEPDPSVADPRRPRFIVDKSPVEFLRERFPADPSLVDKEVDPTSGEGPAFVNTYTLGELPPGERALFRWDVTAVKPGPFEVTWTVEAGTDGKANAVSETGDAPTGSFEGKVADRPVEANLAKDGHTIVTEDGRKIKDNRGVRRTPEPTGTETAP